MVGSTNFSDTNRKYFKNFYFEKKSQKQGTPRRINMQPENTGPLEEENHLNQTIKTSGSMLIFRGVQQLASWFVNGTLSSQRCKSLKLKRIDRWCSYDEVICINQHARAFRQPRKRMLSKFNVYCSKLRGI